MLLVSLKKVNEGNEVDFTCLGGLAGGTLALGLPEFIKKREKLAVKVDAIFSIKSEHLKWRMEVVTQKISPIKGHSKTYSDRGANKMPSGRRQSGFILRSFHKV